MADYQVFYGKDLRIPFKVVTASGKIGKIDGVVSVSSDDALVASVAIDGEFIHVSTLDVGDAVITLSADADLGEGVTYIESHFTVEVLSETASAFDLGTGVEVEKVVVPAEPTA